MQRYPLDFPPENALGHYPAFWIFPGLTDNGIKNPNHGTTEPQTVPYDHGPAVRPGIHASPPSMYLRLLKLAMLNSKKATGQMPN